MPRTMTYVQENPWEQVIPELPFFCPDQEEASCKGIPKSGPLRPPEKEEKLLVPDASLDHSLQLSLGLWAPA